MVKAIDCIDSIEKLYILVQNSKLIHNLF